MWNFAKFDSAPLNSPLSLFSAPCHPKTVKHCNENPLPCRPFPPKLLPTCGNIGLPSHLHTPVAPHFHPHLRPPSPKSHAIPPGPHSPTAQKPRNINDPISKPETPSGELRAKLLGSGPCRPGGRRGACGAWPDNEPTRPAHMSNAAPPVWRAPEGPEGAGGLRGAAPNEVRSPSLAGGRALRRPEHQRRHKRQPTRANGSQRGRLAGGPPPTGTHSGPAHQGRPRGGRRSGGPPPTGAPSSHTHTRQPQQAVPHAAAAQ